MRQNNDLKLIYLCAGIVSVVLLVVCGVIICPDSLTYQRALNCLLNGYPDYSRTPVYPLIIGLAQLLTFNKAAFLCVVVLQEILFFYSIRSFYRVLNEFVASNRIVFWITLFYATYPAFTTYNVTILTESFALSGTVILLEFVIKSINQFSYRNVIYTSLWLMFLTYLRPSFVYLLLIVPFTWTITYLKNKGGIAVLFAGFVFIMITLGGMHIYMKAYEKTYGIYSTSSVGLLNQYYLARKYNYINADFFEDDQLKYTIKKSIDGNNINDHSALMRESGKICSPNSNLADIKNGLAKSAYNNFSAVVKGYFERLYWALRHPVFKSPINGFKYLMNIIGFSLNTVVLMIIFHIGLIITSYRKFFSFPLKTFILILFPIVNLAVITIGAQDEYSRLFLPSLPCILIMFGQYCRMFSFKGHCRLS